MTNNSDDRIHVTRSTHLTTRGTWVLAILFLILIITAMAAVGAVEA